MKLTASEMLTLDGVYQGPGGPDEDRRGGFERGGWTASHADEEMGPFLISLFERAELRALRRTRNGIVSSLLKRGLSCHLIAPTGHDAPIWHRSHAHVTDRRVHDER
jgi:hypothetical protein